MPRLVAVGANMIALATLVGFAILLLSCQGTSILHVEGPTNPAVSIVHLVLLQLLWACLLCSCLLRLFHLRRLWRRISFLLTINALLDGLL